MEPHKNNVIPPTLPGFMHGVVPAKVVSGSITNQQLNTKDGAITDNGSAHRAEAQPAHTPHGGVKGIVGATAREGKRKAPRTRKVDGGGKGGGVHQS